MREMTRRQIEQHCLTLRDALGNLFPSVDDPSREYYWELLDELGKAALSALTARSEGFREPLPEQWQEFYDRVWDSDETNPTLTLPKSELQRIGRALIAVLSPRETDAKVGQGKADVLGEQPTYFEMARTRMLRKRISDIVATHDAFIADHKNKDRAHALKHAIDKARGIGLTKAEQEKQEDYDCPHAYPHRYCETCKVDPCPIGLKHPPPPERQ